MVGIWSLAFLESLFEIFSSLSVLPLQRDKETKREREKEKYMKIQLLCIHYNKLFIFITIVIFDSNICTTIGIETELCRLSFLERSDFLVIAVDLLLPEPWHKLPCSILL